MKNYAVPWQQPYQIIWAMVSVYGCEVAFETYQRGRVFTSVNYTYAIPFDKINHPLMVYIALLW